MARRQLPVRRTTPQVVHYVDPAMQADLAQHMLAQVDPVAYIAKKQRDSELYLRWKIRQAEIAEHDKKFRRFWTGFGALVGAGFLTVVFLGGWWLWTAVGLGVLAVPAIGLIGGAVALGGHRCITIVQHMH